MPDLGHRPCEPDTLIMQQKQVKNYIKETELLFHKAAPGTAVRALRVTSNNSDKGPAVTPIYRGDTACPVAPRMPCCGGVGEDWYSDRVGPAVLGTWALRADAPLPLLSPRSPSVPPRCLTRLRVEAVRDPPPASPGRVRWFLPPTSFRNVLCHEMQEHCHMLGTF